MTFRQAYERTLLTIVRTRDLMAVAILSVLLYAFYYPAPYGHQTARALPLVVVDQDDSDLSRAIVTRLDDTRAVQVVARTGDMAQARRLVQARRAEAILLLPRGGADAIVAQRGAGGMALWLNGTYLLRAEGIGISVAEVAGDALAAWRAQRGLDRRDEIAPPILLHPLFNTTSGYRDYIFPSVASIILQQTLLFACARLVAERRRRGERPPGTVEAVGIWAACATIGCLAALFYFGFVYWVQDIPRMGNPLGLALAVPAFAAAVSALGLWLGGFFADGDDALKVLLPTSVPLVFLGGFAWPLDQMPGWLATLAWLSPATGGMHAFVRLNQMGATLAETGWPLAILAILAALYGGAFMIASRWRLAGFAARPSTAPMRGQDGG